MGLTDPFDILEFVRQRTGRDPRPDLGAQSDSRGPGGLSFSRSRHPSSFGVQRSAKPTPRLGTAGPTAGPPREPVSSMKGPAPNQYTLGTADSPFVFLPRPGDPVQNAFTVVQTVLAESGLTPEQLWAGVGAVPANGQGFVDTMRLRWTEATAAAFGDEALAKVIFSNQLQVDAANAQEQQANAGEGEPEWWTTPEGVAIRLGEQAGMTPREIFDRIYPEATADPTEDAEFFLDPSLGNQPWGFGDDDRF